MLYHVIKHYLRFGLVESLIGLLLKLLKPTTKSTKIMRMRIVIRITMIMIVTNIIVVMKTSFLQKLRLMLQQIMLIFMLA